MVKDFNFASIPDIVFRRGAINDLPGIIRKTGSSVVLVTGTNSFQNSLYGKNILDELRDNNIRLNHVIIKGEPSPEMIDIAVDSCRKDRPDIVVSIGGGSVMDAGKAISAMIPVGGTVKDYLEGVGSMQHPGTKIPFVAVPTTSGTGSEATKNAVLSEPGKDGYKRSLRHNNFVPDVALVDPELTLGCPPEITAASGMDCFTQLIEAYLSDKAVEYTEALAFEGIKAIKRSLKQVCVSGENIKARTDMSFAALTSGICLANAGLGVVHGFASSIGGMYPVPHGVICGTLMAVSNRINVRVLRQNEAGNEALKKYALLGEIFLGKSAKSDDYFIDGFLEYLEDLTLEIKLPKLKESGVRIEDFEQICSSTECKNNPVSLSYENLIEILTERYV